MVKLRSDQQRVKALLKETITLLCKNGLEYKSHFCVDALIGITLDEEDVFLVKISETVSDGKSVSSEAPVHPLPLHMPPTAPSYDIQMMSDSRFPPAQTEPISLSTKTVIPTPPPPAHSAHRKSPTPRKQPTPQPLKNERKRRASSSPAREAAPSQPPSNIPEQPTTTPGASSYLSEHSNQSSLSNSMNMEPERPNSVEREEPGLVRDIAIKDEFSASETENENEGPEQDMPLNMSKSSSSKESTGAAPTIPGCSGWDPAHLQQQVAQAAAAALSTGDSSTPPTPDMAKTPENGEQQRVNSLPPLHALAPSNQQSPHPFLPTNMSLPALAATPPMSFLASSQFLPFLSAGQGLPSMAATMASLMVASSGEASLNNNGSITSTKAGFPVDLTESKKKRRRSSTPGNNNPNAPLEIVDKEVVMAPDNQEYTCKICGKAFKSTWGYKLHKKRHANIYDYQCPYCDKKFTCSANLKGHLVRHTKQPNYICNICGKGYPYKKSLQTHAAVCKGSKEEIKPLMMEENPLMNVPMDDQNTGLGSGGQHIALKIASPYSGLEEMGKSLNRRKKSVPVKLAEQNPMLDEESVLSMM